ELSATLSRAVLHETSTLGVRTYLATRLKCPRWQESVATPWGQVRVKVKQFGSERRASPEYEDCASLARSSGVPVTRIYRAAIASAWDAIDAPSVARPGPST